MPASLPGATLAQNQGNPSQGRPVLFDALSGPKGSPLDRAGSDTPSTGGLCTGIGFGSAVGNPFINIANGTVPATAPQAIKNAGFTDDTGVGLGAADSSMIYIGGGRSDIVPATPEGKSTVVPYTAGFVPGEAGNGGSRDAGAGPVFTCFVGKFVTATGAVANGAAVETGWVNRSGATLAATQSVFGSSTTAQAAVA